MRRVRRGARRRAGARGGRRAPRLGLGRRPHALKREPERVRPPRGQQRGVLHELPRAIARRLVVRSNVALLRLHWRQLGEVAAKDQLQAAERPVPGSRPRPPLDRAGRPLRRVVSHVRHDVVQPVQELPAAHGDLVHDQHARAPHARLDLAREHSFELAVPTRAAAAGPRVQRRATQRLGGDARGRAHGHALAPPAQARRGDHGAQRHGLARARRARQEDVSALPHVAHHGELLVAQLQRRAPAAGHAREDGRQARGRERPRLVGLVGLVKDRLVVRVARRRRRRARALVRGRHPRARRRRPAFHG